MTNLEPTVRLHPVTKQPIYLYSPQQLEAMVHPADRMPPRRAGSQGVQETTTEIRIYRRGPSYTGD